MGLVPLNTGNEESPVFKTEEVSVPECPPKELPSQGAALIERNGLESKQLVPESTVPEVYEVPLADTVFWDWVQEDVDTSAAPTQSEVQFAPE